MQNVPKEFQSLFPSSPVNQLEIRRDKMYIIETLLRNATMLAWRWLVRQYSSDEIATVVKRATGVRKKDVLIWSYYLNIPHQSIVCLQKKFRSGLKTSWTY